MPKVLIIGSLGMLGQELLAAFSADKKYEVTGWDKDEIDITDKAAVVDKISDLAPSIIINAAAYNAVDKSEESAEFELAKELNGLAPGYLAQIAKNLGAIFVHYSSDYVFGGEQIDGYLETAIPSPISRYGQSKLLGEQEVQKVGGQYYIIRLQKLFGRPAQSAMAKRSFFETMLTLAQTKKELEVVDEELANFTFAPDLAKQTKFLLENGLVTGIYHITNEGKPVTWYGAVLVLFKIAGISDVKVVPVSSSRFPRPAKRPRYSILLNTKLPSLRSWEKALAEFLEK